MEWGVGLKALLLDDVIHVDAPCDMTGVGGSCSQLLARTYSLVLKFWVECLLLTRWSCPLCCVY